MQNLPAFCENVLGYRKAILTGQSCGLVLYVFQGEGAALVGWHRDCSWPTSACVPLAKLHGRGLGNIWACCERWWWRVQGVRCSGVWPYNDLS